MTQYEKEGSPLEYLGPVSVDTGEKYQRPPMRKSTDVYKLRGSVVSVCSLHVFLVLAFRLGIGQNFTIRYASRYMGHDTIRISQ